VQNKINPHARVHRNRVKYKFGWIWFAKPDKSIDCNANQVTLKKTWLFCNFALYFWYIETKILQHFWWYIATFLYKTVFLCFSPPQNKRIVSSLWYNIMQYNMRMWSVKPDSVPITSVMYLRGHLLSSIRFKNIRQIKKSIILFDSNISNDRLKNLSDNLDTTASGRKMDLNL